MDTRSHTRARQTPMPGVRPQTTEPQQRIQVETEPAGIPLPSSPPPCSTPPNVPNPHASLVETLATLNPKTRTEILRQIDIDTGN